MGRNYVLLNSGVMRFSRSRTFGRKAQYKWAKPGQKKAVKAAAKPKLIEKKIGGEKNGGSRMVQAKRMRKSFETQELPMKIKAKKHAFHEHKRNLRASITPGTVLILVAGAHKGKHVVFLKQMDTGLLLVTGPYILNGCPLRRISQRYVMATKTKIDISSLEIPARVNDNYFKRERSVKAKSDGGEIFEAKREKYVASPERKEDQVAVDKQLVTLIKKGKDSKLMIGYLRSAFSLSNRQYPHKMVF